MTDKNSSERPAGKPESHHKRYRRRVRRLRRRRRTIKWFLRTAAITTLALLVVVAVGLAGAEHYTAQPDFCASCHVMEPYFESWTHDIHGTKLGIRCVDCHYAPGEKYTITAKFKGLSQAASYFSGRYGSSRPRAHVKNESCLRSACHGDQAFLPKPLMIGERRTETRLIGEREVQITRSPTVQFYHEKHLRVDDRLADAEREIEETAGRLRQALPAGGFERIQSVASSVAVAEERGRSLRALLQELDAGEHSEDAFKLMDLEHRLVRLNQLAGLNCAACHSYDPDGGNHFKVDRQTCYTCHFTHEQFNRNTGTCLNCHEPPTRQIVIHETTSTTQQTPVLMNHQDIVARGIDCASCHLDVVRGDSAVTLRECTHCHDQQQYLAGFEQRTTETVAEYHRVHVAKQRARCVDCHDAIKHELVDPQDVAATASGFLEPVLSDCRHCHPNHHNEQVELLRGVGGEGVHRAMPNAMFGSRLNCRACHTQPGNDFKGAPLVEATAQTCVACHGEDYRSLFDQWVHEITEYQRQAEEAMARVTARVDQIRSAGGTVPAGVDEAIAEAAHNIALVRSANGIHNKNYALQLLDLAVRSLDEAMARLINMPAP